MKESKKNIHIDDDLKHLNTEGVSLYVDAILYKRQSELPEEVLNHVEGCEQCKIAIIEVYELLKGDKNISQQKHPFFKSRKAVKSLYTFFKFTAAAAVLVFIAIYFTNRINDQKDKTIKAGIDTKKTPVKDIFIFPDNLNIDTIKINPDSGTEKLIAVNYAKSLVLESFIETGLRSEDLEILYPLNGAKFKLNQPINFKWKTESRDKIVIEIFYYKNKTDIKLLEKAAQNKELTISNNLKEGLYYWKFISDDELIYVGKFIVTN